MPKAYYNEIDSFAAAWLRELIRAGLIMDGEVDDRDICDVEGSDLVGFDRCHFFAGIGGWDYALQLAGWPDDRIVWTGSCPCQPFSSAGKGKGTDDERHLWPEFARLIGECKPATVFGEQVASKAGREWFDGVSTDLEDMGYAAAAADLCAAGVNAPHIRQRLFWVADAERGAAERPRYEVAAPSSGVPEATRQQRVWPDAGDGKHDHGGLGDADSGRRIEAGHGQPEGNSQAICGRQAGGCGGAESWSDSNLIRCVEPTKEPGRYVEKRRRVESGTLPLAHGIPGRVGLLRGYGNAIVPQVAAEFIGSYLDACNELGAA